MGLVRAFDFDHDFDFDRLLPLQLLPSRFELPLLIRSEPLAPLTPNNRPDPLCRLPALELPPAVLDELASRQPFRPCRHVICDSSRARGERREKERQRIRKTLILRESTFKRGNGGRAMLAIARERVHAHQNIFI